MPSISEEMAMTFAVDWHAKVKKLFEANEGYRSWAKTAQYKGRLIPLCTPIPSSVDVLVIGINHAEFDDRDQREAERIAQAFSRAVPRENTYLEHDHRFARRLREVTLRSGLEISEEWAGTNRYPIQGDWTEIGKLLRRESLESEMDLLILELIRAINPKYVITCGEIPTKIFYGEWLGLGHMKPKVLAGTRTTIVPIWHPSRGSFDKFSVPRLKEYVKV